MRRRCLDTDHVKWGLAGTLYSLSFFLCAFFNTYHIQARAQSTPATLLKFHIKFRLVEPRAYLCTPLPQKSTLTMNTLLAFIWKWPGIFAVFISNQLKGFAVFIFHQVWEWLPWILRWVFYHAPRKFARNRNLEVYQLEKLYLYLKFICYSLYVSPWAMIFIWYLFVRLGCGSSITRPHLDSICLRPYVDPEGGSPWWFDYWDASADGDDTPVPLSPSNEALIFGYLDTIRLRTVPYGSPLFKRD